MAVAIGKGKGLTQKNGQSHAVGEERGKANQK